MIKCLSGIKHCSKYWKYTNELNIKDLIFTELIFMCMRERQVRANKEISKNKY